MGGSQIFLIAFVVIGMIIFNLIAVFIGVKKAEYNNLTAEERQERNLGKLIVSIVGFAIFLGLISGLQWLFKTSENAALIVGGILFGIIAIVALIFAWKREILPALAQVQAPQSAPVYTPRTQAYDMAILSDEQLIENIHAIERFPRAARNNEAKFPGSTDAFYAEVQRRQLVIQPQQVVIDLDGNVLRDVDEPQQQVENKVPSEPVPEDKIEDICDIYAYDE